MPTLDPASLQRFQEEEAFFKLLGTAIYGAPDRACFSAIVENDLFCEIPFVDANACAAAREGLTSWAASCGRPMTEEAFEQVRVDYARLFVGAQRVAAPLWESVYFNRERTVFDKQTMEVRAAYREFGVEVDRYGQEPDDHLAYELMFVARLAHEAAKGGQGSERAVEAQNAFLKRHLLMWVGAWRDLVVQKAPEGSFYRGFAELVVLACEEAERFTRG